MYESVAIALQGAKGCVIDLNYMESLILRFSKEWQEMPFRPARIQASGYSKTYIQKSATAHRGSRSSATLASIDDACNLSELLYRLS